MKNHRFNVPSRFVFSLVEDSNELPEFSASSIEFNESWRKLRETKQISRFRKNFRIFQASSIDHWIMKAESFLEKLPLKKHLVWREAIPEWHWLFFVIGKCSISLFIIEIDQAWKPERKFNDVFIMTIGVNTSDGCLDLQFFRAETWRIV